MLCFEKESKCEMEIGVVCLGLSLGLGRSLDLDPETPVVGFVMKFVKRAQADASKGASQKTLCRESRSRSSDPLAPGRYPISK